MAHVKKIARLGTIVFIALGLAACGSADANQDEPTDKPIGELLNYEIVGVDPGSGHMEATAQALIDYDLQDWDLIPGNGATMAAALKRAYDKEEPIVVAGWSPHWKFIKYDLKFLDDPELLYGDAEEIHSIGRIGLKEDLPEAYAIFQRFTWETEDMGEIMIDIEDGVKPRDAAQTWVDNNESKIAEWTAGVNKVDGDDIELVYAPWDSETASHNMMRIVLEDMGYNVKLTVVEPGPMFTALANGAADATFAAWLPITHKTYVDKFEEDLDDIGVNMVGVRQGLVVPAYMEDINSIEDLNK